MPEPEHFEGPPSEYKIEIRRHPQGHVYLSNLTSPERKNVAHGDTPHEALRNLVGAEASAEETPLDALRGLERHMERHKLAGSTQKIRRLLLSLGGYAHHLDEAVDLSEMRSLDEEKCRWLTLIMMNLRLFEDTDFLEAAGGHEVLVQLSKNH